MNGQTERNVLALLPKIRDSLYSSRATSKGALIQESYAVFRAVKEGLPVAEIRESIHQGKVLSKSAFETRRQIGNAIHHRYLTVCPEWVGKSLARATSMGAQSPDFRSLLYLYYVLRDRLAFEFVVGPVWTKWQKGVTSISSGDFSAFLEQVAQEHPEIKRWRETTRKKLSSNVLSSLRDFGLFKGKNTKHIQRPSILAETGYHLLCVLLAEGRQGRAIVEAPDWRLFLWNEADVFSAFNDLSQRKWIKFERGGRAMILELIRRPEVSL